VPRCFAQSPPPPDKVRARAAGTNPRHWYTVVYHQVCNSGAYFMCCGRLERARTAGCKIGWTSPGRQPRPRPRPCPRTQRRSPCLSCACAFAPRECLGSWRVCSSGTPRTCSRCRMSSDFCWCAVAGGSRGLAAVGGGGGARRAGRRGIGGQNVGGARGGAAGRAGPASDHSGAPRVVRHPQRALCWRTMCRDGGQRLLLMRG